MSKGKGGVDLTASLGLTFNFAPPAGEEYDYRQDRPGRGGGRGRGRAGQRHESYGHEEDSRRAEKKILPGRSITEKIAPFIPFEAAQMFIKGLESDYALHALASSDDGALWDMLKGYRSITNLIEKKDESTEGFEELKGVLKSANLYNYVFDNFGRAVGNEPSPHVRKHLSYDKKMQYELFALYPDSDPFGDRQDNDYPKVLMVSEKPSVAKSIAEFLSGGRMRTRRGIAKMCPVYEFTAQFPPTGMRSTIRVTSVVGHVFGLDFADNRRVDELHLFDSATSKKIEESSQKCHIVEHLRQEAMGCDQLALWLDCDREGENICYEVISITREVFQDDANIYRAKFSAITSQEIGNAFRRLTRPNMNESLSVDARQELDLKVGVAFTRFLTRKLRGMAQQRFNPDIRVISYGPCQSPTLYFCVQRADEIKNFKSEPYWRISAIAMVEGQRCKVPWSGESTKDHKVAMGVHQDCRRLRQATVIDISQKDKDLKRPIPLNTVSLLKACSVGLGLSPHAAMKLAEKLYTSGYISYPRTETTQYSPTFDVLAVLKEHEQHPVWGKTVQWMIRRWDGPPKDQGTDVGDHPPITPTRFATREEFPKGKEWKLYELVARHFLASLLPNCVYSEYSASLLIGKEKFIIQRKVIKDKGFLFATPWRAKDLYGREEENVERQDETAPNLYKGQIIDILDINLETLHTQPPEYLRESDLIALMDKHRIGTDASIPQHIQNIIDRQYVMEPGGQPPKPQKGKYGGKQQKKGQDQGERQGPRLMVPTDLGMSVIHSFSLVDVELVKPDIRAMMESEVLRIANGTMNKQDVVGKNLALFKQKFERYSQRMEVIIPFFDPANAPQSTGAGDGYRGHRGGNSYPYETQANTHGRGHGGRGQPHHQPQHQHAPQQSHQLQAPMPHGPRGPGGQQMNPHFQYGQLPQVGYGDQDAYGGIGNVPHMRGGQGQHGHGGRGRGRGGRGRAQL